MLGPAILVFTNKDGNHKMRDKHADCSSQQKFAATKPIYTPKRPDTGNNLADIHYT
jgi:hypothetical protein